MLSTSRERGSVALVVMILFVMASLATVMVSRVISDSRVAAGVSDRTAALDASDVGLAVARARVAAGETSAFDVDGTTGPLGRWTVSASPVGGLGDRWEVEATGVIRRVTKVVRAELTIDGDGIWRVSGWHEFDTRVAAGGSS